MKNQNPNFSILTFERNGFAVIPHFLKEKEVEGLLGVLEWHRLNQINTSSQILYTHGHAPEDAPPLSAIMTQWMNPHKRLDQGSTIDLAKKIKAQIISLLCKQFNLFQEIIFSKEPGQQTFHWHQDFPFFPLDKPNGFTCWIALDHISAKNGGICLAERSHHLGVFKSIDLHNGQAQGEAESELPDIGKFDIIVPVLEPGDAVLFHPLLWHSSSPNTASAPRRAWATTWIEDGIRWQFANAPNHPFCKLAKDDSFLKDSL